MLFVAIRRASSRSESDSDWLLRRVDKRRLEQTELEFGPEHSPHCRVDEAEIDGPVPDAFDERLAITVRAGELDVDPGVKSGAGGSRSIRRDVVVAGELAHREVVGHDGPSKPHCSSKDVGEEVGGRGAGMPSSS